MLWQRSSALFWRDRMASAKQPVLHPLGGAVPLKTVMPEFWTLPTHVQKLRSVCAKLQTWLGFTWLSQYAVHWSENQQKVNDNVLKVFTCKLGGILEQGSVMNHEASWPGKLSEFLIYNSHDTMLLYTPTLHLEKVCTLIFPHARYSQKHYLLLLCAYGLQNCQVASKQ